jgi:hypothetical protein
MTSSMALTACGHDGLTISGQSDEVGAKADGSPLPTKTYRWISLTKECLHALEDNAARNAPVAPPRDWAETRMPGGLGEAKAKKLAHRAKPHFRTFSVQATKKHLA